VAEGVGADPLPENVDGSIVEKHTWNHEVRHAVQWDYVLLALLGLLVVWFVFVQPDGSDVPGEEEEGGVLE
jgi:hypothetical protein